jgi:hypothetical protein
MAGTGESPHLSREVGLETVVFPNKNIRLFSGYFHGRDGGNRPTSRERWGWRPLYFLIKTSACSADISMAGTGGIEPTLKVLETSVLPLYYVPMYLLQSKSF